MPARCTSAAAPVPVNLLACGGMATAPLGDIALRRAQRADGPALIECLASAFRDNPLNRAVIEGDAARRLRANRAGMRATFAATAERGSLWVAEEPGAPAIGGLVSVPPGEWPLAPPPLLEQVRVLIGQGIRTARRWGDVFQALESRHPIEPSWYLSLVGVTPDVQGRGAGGALLARWLADDVDAEASPAYLETDQPHLVRFYERFEFEPLLESELLGVRVWHLWRPAREAANDGPRQAPEGGGGSVDYTLMRCNGS